MSSETPVELGKAKVKRETNKALLCFVDDLAREIWIPKSQIHDDSEVFDGNDNSEGELVVKAWFAEKEKLA